jgi:DivIVA domain-containing protein
MADDRRYTAADVPVTAEEVAHRGFSTAFRGFDPNEVRAYLTRVAESLRAAKDRQRELEQHARDADARAANPRLDEATLANALGEHTSRIIRSAHEAASDIRGKAEESVEQILKDAHEEASKLRADAERVLTDRVTEAEAEANAVRQAADADAQGIGRRAQDQADRLVERARQQSKEMANEVQALRNRVMGDLMRRRRVALVQVEQLQAGRDRLLEAYRVVRRTMDEATEALQRAEADARAAAEAAAHRVAAEPEPTADELLNPEPEPTVTADVVADAPTYSRPPDQSSSVRLVKPIVEPETAEPVEPEPVRPALKIVQPPSEVESVRVIRADEAPPAPEPVAAPEPEPVAEPEPAPVEAVEPEPAEPVAEIFAKLREEQSDVSVELVPERSLSTDTVVLSDEDTLIQKRDEVLAPVALELMRKLKRALQDEQNEVLDRLRRHGGHKPSLAIAFPAGVDQRERYRTISAPHLATAMAAGSAWAGGRAPGDDVLVAVADELADALVAPLARRLEQTLDEAASMGDDESAVTGRVSATYRDVKGRLERLAADHVGSAYAAGAFGVWAPGTPLRWIVRDVDGECPDCDDNALAGSTPSGEAYPTGQVHPPAHAGCHCMLVPAPPT